MNLIDISPTISPRLAVFPGDTPASREVLLEIEQGAPITLSTLRATVHLGAHADAPSHYGAGARTIERQPLETYLGSCQVIRVPCAARQVIRPADLGVGIRAPRVLLATGSQRDPERWTGDFAALTVELVDHLAATGALLIGVDTPSVDLSDSKELPVHHRILAHDIAILEGLALDGVAPGLYELIALPLRLEGFDASPVRAILRAMP
jgi:arylformamidase